MSAVARVDVVVPVRDEEHHLAECLAALTVAAGFAGVPTRLFVVLDRCTDGSEGVARAAGVETLTTHVGAVGAARDIGIRHVLAFDGTGTGAVTDCASRWLACTDGDSVVPHTWLATQVAAAEAGADCVIGTVEPRGLSAEQEAQWRRRHRLTEGHPHIHGANLGVRASAYLAVGGFAATSVHEDVDLVTRLRADGYRCLPTDTTRVLTSGRTRSHVTGGFATYLADLT